MYYNTVYILKCLSRVFLWIQLNDSIKSVIELKHMSFMHVLHSKCKKITFEVLRFYAIHYFGVLECSEIVSYEYYLVISFQNV